jgi:hypothetical protein
MTPAIRLSPNDNLVAACRNLMAGEMISVIDETLLIQDDVNLGHKIEMSSLVPRDKYGKCNVIIGSATTGICVGQCFYIHNMPSGYIPTHPQGAEGRNA